MAKKRTYMCIDMKSFFASVECAERGLNPFETNLVVADETRGDGTICLAITPKMKSLGVKNRLYYNLTRKNYGSQLQQVMEIANRQGDDQDGNAPKSRHLHDHARQTRQERNGVNGGSPQNLQGSRLQRRRHNGRS